MSDNISDKIKNIVVVCSGNTCRSPMGAALLNDALTKENELLRSLKVISAGISAFPGSSASTESINCLRSLGIDITNHRSQRFTESMMNDNTIIICMTEQHRQKINEIAGYQVQNTILFRQFCDDDRDISDPYGGSSVKYKKCLEEIKEAIPSLVNYIKDKLVKE